MVPRVPVTELATSDLTPGISGRTSLVAGIGIREPGHMEAIEVRSGQPEDDGAAAPAQRFVVIVGELADGGSAFRIEDPDRLLRVWSMLKATAEQLEGAILTPERMLALQRQLQVIRHEFEQAVSPPVAAELARILPPCDAAPGSGALRIECAALTGWIGSLVTRMLGVLMTASDQSDQAAVTDEVEAAHGSRVRATGPEPPPLTEYEPGHLVAGAEL